MQTKTITGILAAALVVGATAPALAALKGPQLAAREISKDQIEPPRASHGPLAERPDKRVVWDAVSDASSATDEAVERSETLREARATLRPIAERIPVRLDERGGQVSHGPGDGHVGLEPGGGVVPLGPN